MEPLEEALEKVCGQLTGIRLPKWNELPDLEIYMDQLLSLVARYLTGYLPPDDKGLTSSMVNNYVKMGLLPPPVNKRYHRVHLSRLIIICVLKCAMPIASIQRQLTMGNSDHESPETLYDAFTEMFTEINNDACAASRALANSDHTISELILRSSLRAQAEQVLADRLLRISAEPDVIPLK